VRADLATTKTLTLTKSNRYKPAAGFTLIEVMVVMAIIAAIITVGIGQINKGGNEIKETLRKMSTLSKQVHSLAKLNTATYRIVFDLGSGKDDADQTYWVEKALGAVVISTEDFNEKYDETPETKDEDNESKAPPSGGFTKDEKVIKGQRKLPSSVKFEAIITPSIEDPIKEGRAYVYFFPQGLADEAIVQVKGKGSGNEKLEFTLAVRPLNGKMDIINGLKTLKDINE
jgi:general secretion pathway protein H